MHSRETQEFKTQKEKNGINGVCLAMGTAPASGAGGRWKALIAPLGFLLKGARELVSQV